MLIIPQPRCGGKLEKMAESRTGRQTPTAAVVLPYTAMRGQEAIGLYNSTGNTAQQRKNRS